jgi:transcriptional regulator with XRE-family HTH domain
MIDKIKDLRRAKGYKNTEIADAIGVSLSTVNKVISNKAKPLTVGRVLQFLTKAPALYKMTESEKQKYIEDYK